MPRPGLRGNVLCRQNLRRVNFPCEVEAGVPVGNAPRPGRVLVSNCGLSLKVGRQQRHLRRIPVPLGFSFYHITASRFRRRRCDDPATSDRQFACQHLRATAGRESSSRLFMSPIGSCRWGSFVGSQTPPSNLRARLDRCRTALTPRLRLGSEVHQGNSRPTTSLPVQVAEGTVVDGGNSSLAQP